MPKVFRNSSNYHDVNKELGIVTGEVNDEPSMTVPDQVHTLRQLIERHRQGQHVPVKDAKYDDDVEEFNEKFPDISKMSKIELAELSFSLKEFIKNQRDVIQRFNESKKQESAITNTEGSTETGKEANEPKE